MLEKNYKLAEMIFLEQVTGEKGCEGEGIRGEKAVRPAAAWGVFQTFQERYT